MRQRVAAIKKRMDRFDRPDTCAKPWLIDPSTAMNTWFSNLDAHPCTVASNLVEGTELWLQNFGCQDAIIERFETNYGDKNWNSRKDSRKIARRKRMIYRYNLEITRAPCRQDFLHGHVEETTSPETSTQGSTEATTTTVFTTTTQPWWTSAWWASAVTVNNGR
ncbi:Oidioi.mRNA.OKI2018_I69.chr2.g4527.t1.cds [Oikopleura dioica]|uniref:Oidioi.mRNA.OKI2018_I69.chr2.g4527.t1.cds n=1 Tax=Oikopleura dioica TaxID=34765 RepID=A0ABN7T381_OIKDI|nr:Oidioi.mRNA.OKI2018_I69.chr2.g4527.t1.cds [Oikopleura dioica]